MDINYWAIAHIGKEYLSLLFQKTDFLGRGGLSHHAVCKTSQATLSLSNII